ncbi:MAG TPA: hypothetical protein VGL86_19990 [Polyangia bacterium]
MRRAAAIVLALAACAGCKLLPDNGYAVDVTVVAGPSLSGADADAIVTLDESVSGGESYQRSISVAGPLQNGASFIYRPGVGSGELTFTFEGLDGAGHVVAEGAGTVTLRPGATAVLRVVLDAVSTPPADLATALANDLGLSDDALCDQACATLIGCGVQDDPVQCPSNCKSNSTVFRTCARTAGSDCNQLALCSFAQLQATSCGGSGGYPTGSATCKTTAMCEGACNLDNPTLACLCGCVAALDPARALDSAIRYTCASMMCGSVCAGAGFNGAACNSCASMNCGNDACASN